MEYLEKIQKIMKLFKILAKIAFVACIVGASLCLVALVFLLLADTLDFIEEAEAVRMVGKMDETFTTAYCAVAMGMVNCLTALFVTRRRTALHSPWKAESSLGRWQSSPLS